MYIEPCSFYRPLDTATIHCDAPTLRVHDGMGRPYAEGAGPEFSFPVSGALGYHVAVAYDSDGVEIERKPFKVNCKSYVKDAGDRFGSLFRILHNIMERHYAGMKRRVFDGEEVYRTLCITSRGTYTAGQGGRYFHESLQDSSNLFAKYQREDGMIWDFGMSVEQDKRYHFEWRWGKDFSMRVYRDSVIFARQPVMNDVEHQYINGIYLAWQVSGDDAWMAGMLDSALRAIEYVRTSPYTWSEKFQLIHRPYCLDLWDFQSEFDAALTGGDVMDAKPGVSKFGVFYGDNVCMAQACRNLSRMLDHCGRSEAAERTRGFAEELQERVDALSWNGEFYRHHVSEHPEFERDFGIDESRVVSLSNSFAANFEIGHEKAKAIIETYRRIRREMPEECPAEFMTMYPAFPRGFHIKAGSYVNGACAGLVAGELARAAFSHGCEAYGADVLERYRELFEPYAPLIDGGMWGTPPTPPERDFQCLDLRSVANADLRCDETHDGWGGEKGNDMRSIPVGRQEFVGIPVMVIDPESNSGCACLRIANDTEGFADSLTIPVAQKAASIYFLHGAQGGATVAGELEAHYTDGSEHRQYVVLNKHIQDTWNPGEVRPKRVIPRMMTAWNGETDVFDNVGLSIWGWDNPHPENEITELRLNASLESARWMIVGITLSDAEVWLPPTPTFEGPNQYWSAACVTRAIGEGLVGVVDTDRNMHAVTISPRWGAAGIDEADACLKYEDGGGYVAYRYRADDNHLSFDLAGSGESRRVRLPLPEGASVRKATVDGMSVEVSLEKIDASTYACLDIADVASVGIKIEMQFENGEHDDSV